MSIGYIKTKLTPSKSENTIIFYR